MAKVERVPLQSVAEIDRVGVAPMAMGDKPYVSLEDIDSVSGAVQVASRGQSKSTKFRFDQKHVLYGKLRPYLQKVARPTRAGLCSTDILPIRPSDRLDRDYLFHFLRTPDFTAKATRAAVGVNLPRLSPSVLSTFDIPLTTLNEQKRIAGILDAADALRAKRRESLSQLDTLLQSTFLDMFGDPVTNPMGWNMVTLKEVGSSRLGKMLDKGKHKGGCHFPYLANFNVQWGSIELAELRSMEFTDADREEFKLDNGDLLVCEGGEVGRTAIWRCEREHVYFQKALHRIRLDRSKSVPEYFQYFMWFMAKNGGFRDFTNSATISHLTGVKLKSLPFPLPPLDLQRRFAAIVESVEQQKARLRAHLDALFASLQSRAFNGAL